MEASIIVAAAIAPAASRALSAGESLPAGAMNGGMPLTSGGGAPVTLGGEVPATAEGEVPVTPGDKATFIPGGKAPHAPGVWVSPAPSAGGAPASGEGPILPDFREMLLAFAGRGLDSAPALAARRGLPHASLIGGRAARHHGAEGAQAGKGPQEEVKPAEEATPPGGVQAAVALGRTAISPQPALQPAWPPAGQPSGALAGQLEGLPSGQLVGLLAIESAALLAVQQGEQLVMTRTSTCASGPEVSVGPEPAGAAIEAVGAVDDGQAAAAGAAPDSTALGPIVREAPQSPSDLGGEPPSGDAAGVRDAAASDGMAPPSWVNGAAGEATAVGRTPAAGRLAPADSTSDGVAMQPGGKIIQLGDAAAQPGHGIYPSAPERLQPSAKLQEAPQLSPELSRLMSAKATRGEGYQFPAPPVGPGRVPDAGPIRVFDSGTPGESVHAEPVAMELPTEPVPVEMVSTKPASVTPAPAEPAPARPAHAGPVPVKPLPAESAPPRSAPMELARMDPVPVGPAPAGPVPVKSIPAGAVASEARPVELEHREPGHAKSAGAGPAHAGSAPAEPAPAEKASERSGLAPDKLEPARSGTGIHRSAGTPAELRDVARGDSRTWSGSPDRGNELGAGETPASKTLASEGHRAAGADTGHASADSGRAGSDSGRAGSNTGHVRPDMGRVNPDVERESPDPGRIGFDRRVSADSGGTSADTDQAAYRGTMGDSNLAGHRMPGITPQRDFGIDLQTGAGLREEARDVAWQVVEKAAIQIRQGASQMTIQLRPESLGRLHLRIAEEGSMVNIGIRAENETAKALIETGLGELRAALAEHGVRVDRVNVAIGPGNPDMMAGGSGFAFARHGNESPMWQTPPWVPGAYAYEVPELQDRASVEVRTPVASKAGSLNRIV